MRRVLDASIADMANDESKRLSRSIHPLQVNNELLHHENLGLKEALNAQSKREKRQTTLQLQNDNTWHSSAVVHSLRKVNEGCRREAAKTGRSQARRADENSELRAGVNGSVVSQEAGESCK